MLDPSEKRVFLRLFNQVTYEVHEDAKKKGWYDDRDRHPAEMIALCHAELSEALEAFREGVPKSNVIPSFDSVEAELADVIIRIMDLAEYKGMDIAGALLAKMEFNKTRPYRHGGKKF